MLTFRCICGNEFEDLADAGTKEVPCSRCGLGAVVIWKASAPSVRGSGEPLSPNERSQALMTFGKEALPIETKGEMKKFLKKKRHVAVSSKELSTMIDQHASVNEAAARMEPTKEQREKRRAELKPVIDRAKQRVRSGNAPISYMPRSEAAIPSDVKSAIPDSAKAATGVKEI